ncbi:MAG: FtsQ-type POTRA domain-containing protein [Rhodobacteraceae bacterium]|nr:FtsQ-type POTRA domain-containing protein [Paracoccaceae bacterium]
MRRLRYLLLAIAVSAVCVAAWRAGYLAEAPYIVADTRDLAVDLSVAAGLRLDALTVEGRDQTDPAAILGAVDLERGSPILTIDVDRIQEAVEGLPWVKRAQVERKLPGTLHIVIEEKRPFALWQRDSRYTLVDAEGHVMGDVPGQYGDLPLIVGQGAPGAAARLFDELAQFPQLSGRVRAAVYVGERRWNLFFDAFEDGVSVRMPAGDLPAALDRLSALDRDYRILERDLEFIDLRIPDQLVVRLRQPANDSVAVPASAPAGNSKHDA